MPAASVCDQLPDDDPRAVAGDVELGDARRVAGEWHWPAPCRQASAFPPGCRSRRPGSARSSGCGRRSRRRRFRRCRRRRTARSSRRSGGCRRPRTASRRVRRVRRSGPGSSGPAMPWTRLPSSSRTGIPVVAVGEARGADVGAAEGERRQIRARFVQVGGERRRRERIVGGDARVGRGPAIGAASRDVGIDAAVGRVPGARDRAAVDAVEDPCPRRPGSRRTAAGRRRGRTRRRSRRCPLPRRAHRRGSRAAERRPPAAGRARSGTGRSRIAVKGNVVKV